MNTKNVSRIAIGEKMKLRNTFGRQIVILAGIRKKLFMRKAG